MYPSPTTSPPSAAATEGRWKATARGWRHRLLRDLLGHPLAAWRHRRTKRQALPNGHHSYTCFFRLPLQLQALCGPVLDRLLQVPPDGNTSSHPGSPRPSQTQARQDPGSGENPLRILLFACSNGAEAYSLAAWLQARRPTLQFQIVASDWQAVNVEQSRRGVYTREEVFQRQPIDPAWTARVFDIDPLAASIQDGNHDGHWVVNARTRAAVRFETADLVRDDLAARFGQADLVLAQNVFFHLKPSDAEPAFANLKRTLAPRAALAIDGMDLDQRVRLTRAAGLEPLDWRVREIHEAARRHVAERWWDYPYGCEPWLPWRRDKARRYGTLFLTAEAAQGRARSQAPDPFHTHTHIQDRRPDPGGESTASTSGPPA